MCARIHLNRAVDLEIHIKSSHAQYELFKCDKCEKNFSLKWRLKKHMELHTTKVTKQCHYFNNCEKCPFEEYGCKFLHTVSKKCIYSQRCERKLCPYRHFEEKNNSKDINNVDNIEESDSEDIDTTDEEKKSFTTSTPRKRKFECDDCNNKSQCVDCYVRQDNAPRQRVHFSDDVEFEGF